MLLLDFMWLFGVQTHEGFFVKVPFITAFMRNISVTKYMLSEILLIISASHLENAVE